jgi:hypothetical protein
MSSRFIRTINGDFVAIAKIVRVVAAGAPKGRRLVYVEGFEAPEIVSCVSLQGVLPQNDAFDDEVYETLGS